MFAGCDRRSHGPRIFAVARRARARPAQLHAPGRRTCQAPAEPSSRIFAEAHPPPHLHAFFVSQGRSRCCSMYRGTLLKSPPRRPVQLVGSAAPPGSRPITASRNLVESASAPNEDGFVRVRTARGFRADMAGLAACLAARRPLLRPRSLPLLPEQQRLRFAPAAPSPSSSPHTRVRLRGSSPRRLRRAALWLESVGGGHSRFGGVYRTA